MKRVYLIKLLERSESLHFGHVATDGCTDLACDACSPKRARLAVLLDNAARWDLRADARRAYGYLIEATVDDGTRLYSELTDDAVIAVDIYLDLIGRTMVRRVAILVAHTGQVLCDLPSRAVAAGAMSRLEMRADRFERRDHGLGDPDRDPVAPGQRGRPSGLVGTTRVWVNR